MVPIILHFRLRNEAGSGVTPMSTPDGSSVGDGASVKLNVSPSTSDHEGVASFFLQLSALFKKDFVIRKWKRHYFRSLVELLLPITLIGAFLNPLFHMYRNF